jgi:hypothetical protein
MPQIFNDAVLEFDERGNLTYIIKEAKKDRVILMTYRVVGDLVITAQLSLRTRNPLVSK